MYYNRCIHLPNKLKMNKTMHAKNASPKIVYITRDIERALGVLPGSPSYEHYYIVTNASSYAQKIQAQIQAPQHIILSERSNTSGELLDTLDLMKEPALEKAIDTLVNEGASILVFKNTKAIEEFCAAKKWPLLNPSAALAESVENKILQASWLGDLASLLPPFTIQKAKDVVLEKDSKGNVKPIILQWAHSHTGDGTLLVNDQSVLDLIRTKFPEREARITQFVNGPVFTANVAVQLSPSPRVFVGNISYQITGVLPFTENPFSTIGNDWSITHSLLSESQVAEFERIAQEVGMKMAQAGWKGLFGIDCIYDEERSIMHLLEINARQSASTTYESQLQHASPFYNTALNTHSNKNLTIFELHLQCLADTDTHTGAAKQDQLGSNVSNTLINDGAQIIQRLTSTLDTSIQNLNKKTSELEALGLNVIAYENEKMNSDILRIQSKRGIMEAHNKLNTRGKEILDILI